MPVYEYTAFDQQGRKLEGIIDAGSVTAAKQKLRETHLFPIGLSESAVEKKDDRAGSKSVGNLFGKVGLREVSVMTRQLSTLLGAGLPLVPSFTTLVSQTTHPEMKKTLAQIKEEVNEGNSLTASMSHFPRIFPPFYINMVRAGEASGTLNLVLERLADFNERQQELRTRIRSTLAYPTLMFLIGSLVLFFLVAFVVPNITQIFQEMNQALPAITILLIAVSSFLKSYWWVVAMVAVLIVSGLRYAIAVTPKGQYLWDKIKLKAPFFGSVYRQMAVARFSRTLGTLLQSGVPLLAAMDIVRNVVDNRLIADDLQTASREVEEGQSLSTSLAKSGHFPPIVIEMISVGEHSGNLEPMLYRVADSYEKDVEASVIMMTSLLEPAMILFMGLVVGFIVVSVLLPIFEMNQLVR
ncbi:MAG: type II secretion system inner membrane protein GspF [Pseudomonadota bacterium]